MTNQASSDGTICAVPLAAAASFCNRPFGHVGQHLFKAAMPEATISIRDEELSVALERFAWWRRRWEAEAGEAQRLRTALERIMDAAGFRCTRRPVPPSPAQPTETLRCSRCGAPREDGMSWLKDALCEACQAQPTEVDRG